MEANFDELSEPSDETCGDSSNQDFRAHSCKHCQKLMVNTNFDYDMGNEENEWVNIQLEATLSDLVEGFESGCNFARRLGSSDLGADKTFPDKFILSAKLQPHAEFGNFADRIGPFSLWNTDLQKVDGNLGDMFDIFGLCTTEG
jgi:hypothetical protein